MPQNKASTPRGVVRKCHQWTVASHGAPLMTYLRIRQTT